MLNCTAAPESAINSALNPQIPKQTRLLGQIFSLKSDLNLSYMLDDFPYQIEIYLFTGTRTSYLFDIRSYLFLFFIFNFSIKQWLLRS